MKINRYLKFVQNTDRLPSNDLSAVLHGLFGEVGGIMVAAKKLKREPGVYTGFDKVLIEELGDTFWYLCCLAGRLDVDVSEVLIQLTKVSNSKPELIVGDDSSLSITYIQSLNGDFDGALVKLGQLTGDFLSAEYVLKDPRGKVYSFLQMYFEVINLLKIEFKQVLTSNVEKISSRFIRPENSNLPTFDSSFPDYERLPDDFEIEFIQRAPNLQAIRCNGIFLGDPLTDSIGDEDGYRFHDVFHFSNAAVLHWSPTFRSLLKHKRKSDPIIDETQDGGRAIVVEEGLLAWIFTIAKENDFFRENKSLTFDMLKNIDQFVKGFEVEQCPLILWEECILKSYEVFRQVRSNAGGKVVGSRKCRTLRYIET